MIYPLFTQILNMGITASFVILAVLLIRAFMHNLPKKYCYLLWGIVGIRLLCPAAISSPVSLFNIIGTDVTNMVSMEIAEKNINIRETNTTDAIPDSQPSENNMKPANTTGNFPDFPLTASEKEAKNVQFSNTNKNDTAPSISTIQKKQINPIVKYGAIIWLSGMALLLLWNFYTILCIKKRLKKAVRYHGNIYECENIPSPFVIGILCPRIYIPFQLGEQERDYILQHEQHHIRRRDYLIKPAAFLLTCIYWFHPLVWLSYFLMIRDMEMSCDEYVLQHMAVDIRKDYCRSLLGFAVNQRNLTAGLLAFCETDTRKRVKNVLNFKKHRKWIGILAIFIVAIAGTVCLTNAKNNNTNTDTQTTRTQSEIQSEIQSGTQSNKNTKKKKTAESGKNDNAVITSAKIHGYEVKLVFISEAEKLPENKNDLESDFYHGTFELQTYQNQELCASCPLTFDFTDTLSYPKNGFDLVIKDYDGDGDDDDFALGQGQLAIPLLGNFMSYQIYTVDKDGSIANYVFSENKTSLWTIPAEYSKEFSCKNGQITYQELGENGVEKQTINVIRLIPVNSIHTENPDMQPLQELMTGIETVMPEAVINEIKENGCWRLNSGTCSLGNAKLSDDITLRLDFSYDGTQLEQYVSKEYGFVSTMPEDRIDKEQAKELIAAFESAFLGREITKDDIKDSTGYAGYEGEDYAAFIDSYQDTFLVQLSKNMIIKYDANKKRLKTNAFSFNTMGVTIKLPENKTWIQNASASEKEDIGIVTYYDAIAETDATLCFGKKNQKEMLGFSNSDPDSNEYWSFFPGKQEQLITVQFHPLKNDTTRIVLSWEYNQIYFYLYADFTDLQFSENGLSASWEPLAKTAAYAAENYYQTLWDTNAAVFSDNDIKAAKTAVRKYFKKTFPDCKLQKLWFDKETYWNQAAYYANLYNKEDIIVLLSNFYVSKDCTDNSLEHDTDYLNFLWILSKDKNSNWNVETYGY